MSDHQNPRFLRSVMLLDAASVLASGVPQVLVTSWLGRWTGLPHELLLTTGLFLLAYAAFASWIGTRRPMPVALVQLVIAGNLAWGAGCIGLMLFGPFALSSWGFAYLMLHLVAVLSFAALQWTGLRRMSAGAAHMAA